MYDRMITICYLSSDDLCEDLIHKALRKRHYVYELKKLWDRVLSYNPDIILLDAESKTFDFKTVSPSTYVIYMGSLEECQHMGALVDELWVRPCSADYIIHRIEILCDAVLEHEVAWHHANCLDVLIDSMPDLVWFKDNAGIHTKVNKMFAETVGKPRAEITGKDHCAVWDVETDDCAATEDIVRRELKTCQFVERVSSSHGMRQFRTYKSPLFDRAGNLMGTVGIGHDITDLENMSTEMEIFLRSMPFAILIKDKDGIILNVNKKFEEYFHTSKEAMITRIYDEWKADVIDEKKSIEHNGYHEVYVSCDDSDHIMEIRYEPIYDIFHEQAGQLCIYRDVTKEYLLEQQILYRSNTDFLTGLSNRRYFYEYISNDHGAAQVSLLYVDLDHFKVVNDTYGHQIGDEALMTVADVLRERFPNDLTARLGGDEFLITLTYTISEEELQRKGDMLVEALHEAFMKNPYFKVLSASIGIAFTDDITQKIDVLIQESDAALYHAKHAGRSMACIYHEEMKNIEKNIHFR